MVNYNKGDADGDEVGHSSITAKISGKKTVNSSLSALLYGQAVENEGAESFFF